MGRVRQFGGAEVGARSEDPREGVEPELTDVWDVVLHPAEPAAEWEVALDQGYGDPRAKLACRIWSGDTESI